MHKLKLIIFDVNETLLSLDPLKKSVGKVLGGREELLPLWFSTLLHYSLVETMTGDFHTFAEIGSAALMMVAETQGVKLEQDNAREAVERPLRSLPPHSDVMAGLQALRKEKRFQLVTLTNSSAAGAASQLKKAGLMGLFDNGFTVESLGKYKPHPDVYRQVLESMAVQPEEALMVAAHAWDLMGAGQVGLQTAFIARPGKALYPNTVRPDYVVRDLPELAKMLLQETSRVGE